ncbi:hypothetical protein [Cytobacillus purgationiresistens]|uniref:Formylmethanofuran dehydrogenase subunit E n=1 Tax=Cytobacillus purgationiresistens TaxID=863449 RepID=A0ABU0ALN6_9BACI|nr:hypothetical protein [Cytobacillus purgationiresistens]MDQ0270950.1 formylmethanofuran dehydrogenase subunit E [Cytobacillus purgationiresistens]
MSEFIVCQECKELTSYENITLINKKSICESCCKIIYEPLLQISANHKK